MCADDEDDPLDEVLALCHWILCVLLGLVIAGLVMVLCIIFLPPV